MAKLSRIQHVLIARPTVYRHRSRQACTLFISLCAVYLVYIQLLVPKNIMQEQMAVFGRSSPE